MNIERLQYKINDFFTRGETLLFAQGDGFDIPQEERETVARFCPALPFARGGASFSITSDNNLLPEAYTLRVSGDKKIIITYGGKRGKKYALMLLAYLIDRDGEGVSILSAYAEDAPCLALRGVIEGFYGAPYSFSARMDVLDTCETMRLNSYFYAPKDDLYHREKWREPYPAQEKTELAALVKAALDRDVDFYYCISPGKDFCFAENQDFDALCEKISQLSKIGANRFALLLDDIDYSLKGRDAELFSTPGRAHGALVTRLAGFLAQSGLPPLTVCPTEYMQNFDTPYRRDLRESTDADVSVFWTGYNTVAEVVSDGDCRTVKPSLGHPLILWDNYPVNDFEPKRRIYLDALKNRTSTLADTHAGMVSNPMCQWYASRFAVHTMADYMWNPARYLPAVSLDCAVEDLVEPDLRAAAKSFISINSACVMSVGSDGLKSMLDKKNYAAVDTYYTQNTAAVKSLFSLRDRAMLEELKPYLSYFLAESALYFHFREGGDVTQEAETLSNAAVRTGDQSLLDHLLSLGRVSAKTCKIDKEREIFWKI